MRAILSGSIIVITIITGVKKDVSDSYSSHPLDYKIDEFANLCTWKKMMR